jgi:hypothetical protein
MALGAIGPGAGGAASEGVESAERALATAHRLLGVFISARDLRPTASLNTALQSKAGARLDADPNYN